MNDEYIVLRDEMNQYYQNIANYNIALYTASSVIFAFALGQKDYYYCLIPLLVIVPLYLLCENEHKKACKLGAYLYVFSEGKDFNWERRHHIFDRTRVEKGKKPRRSIDEILSYIMFCAISCLSSIIKIYYIKTLHWVHYCLPIVAFLISLIIIIRNEVQYNSLRQFYIERWFNQMNEEDTYFSLNKFNKPNQ